MGIVLFFHVISAQLTLAETHKPFLFEGPDGFVFHFETNGSYSVYMEYYSMATKDRRRMDEGSWGELPTNRIKMTSKRLLSPPIMAYSCLKVDISTLETISSWLSAVNLLLSSSTNQVFSGNDFQQATIMADKSCVQERREETRTGVKINNPIPRSDFEMFQRDLRRQQNDPVWWEVTCTLVKDDDVVTLVPEKSKIESFLTLYRLNPTPPDNFEPYEFPKLRSSTSPPHLGGK